MEGLHIITFDPAKSVKAQNQGCQEYDRLRKTYRLIMDNINSIAVKSIKYTRLIKFGIA